jgi:putative transposase
MASETAAHRCRSLRLKGYDYAQAGAYFVTICTQGRTCLFGEVVDDTMHLNDAGEMLTALWTGIPARIANVEVDAFVVIPNHLHGIIVLPDRDEIGDVVDHVGAPLVGAHGRATTTKKKTTIGVAPTIGDVVGAFKSLATVEYIRGVKSAAWPAFRTRLWQRNYYEHVIRNEEGLNRVRRYIDENPARWVFDDENPEKAR